MKLLVAALCVALILATVAHGDTAYLPALPQQPAPLPDLIALHLPPGLTLYCGADETGGEVGDGYILWSGYVVDAAGHGYEGVFLQARDGSVQEITPSPHMGARGALSGVAMPGPYLFACDKGRGYAQRVVMR
jgi:hypothetical protein